MARLDTSDDFVKKSMRHLAQLGAPQIESPKDAPPFPDDWFDWPKDTLEDYGAMMMLMSLTQFHRPRSMAEVFYGLETPLRLKQYKIFRSTGGHPRAFMTWAGLSTEAERHFAVEHQMLEPHHWTSGTSRWVIDFVTPFGHTEQIIKMMTNTPNTNRLRTLWHNKDGNRARVIEWSRSHFGATPRVASYGHGQFEKLLRAGG